MSPRLFGLWTGPVLLIGLSACASNPSDTHWRVKSAGAVEQRGTLQAEPLPPMWGFTLAKRWLVQPVADAMAQLKGARP